MTLYVRQQLLVYCSYVWYHWQAQDIHSLRLILKFFLLKFLGKPQKVAAWTD